MQCILREKLLEQATKLAEVSSVYRTDSSRFVAMYFAWLNEAEADLSRLRAPISVLLQGEKASLTSVIDGYLPDNIREARSSRKILRAAAAQSLERISKEIYSKIEKIDRTLDHLNEQLCHAVAVLASKNSGFYDKLKVNQKGVDMIWKKLSETTETAPMYNYFCAKLTSTDRNYLLMDIIQKITSTRIGGTP